MPRTEDVHQMVKLVADAVSLSEVQALDGKPTVTGHGYYEPGALASLALLSWLINRKPWLDRDDLLDVMEDLLAAVRRQDWADMEGGERHGR